jgi:glycosyltransferase involved in cell wall biosynthesis
MNRMEVERTRDGDDRSASTALVHDYLLVMRGAERTFAAMATCWPDAPIYTLLHDPSGTRGQFEGRSICTSYLQRLGAHQGNFRLLLPLFPRATERLPVQDHELVISSSSAFAHGVRPGPEAMHVSYCHTPFRYVWDQHQRALSESPRLLRPLARGTLARIRRWDREASTRVTHYIANAEITRRRIQDFYGRDARVVHPPVEVERFSPGAPEDFFLAVGEIVGHKRIELALEAARRAGRQIKVVGAGRDLPRLASLYGASAEFVGRVSDAELEDLYARTRALIVPNVEEFGIAAVEAQASGRPVVAVDAGGAQETVVPGKTGVLVPPDDVDALADALANTDFDSFSPEEITKHAAGFSTSAFRKRLLAEVDRLTGRPGAGQDAPALPRAPSSVRSASP